MRTSFVWAILLAIRLQAHAVLRGLAPEVQDLFTPGMPFRCSDGKELSFENLNDEFCDCADGSDEPGTGACAGQDGTLFHCVNKGSTPQLVYSSRVDDGICDCCDGSDEAGLTARHPSQACADRCAEEGLADRQQRAERMELLKEGLAKKAAIIEEATTKRAEWQAEIARLEAELPGLEAALADAKKVEAAAKPVAGVVGTADASSAELQAEIEELRKTVAEHQTLIDELRREIDALKGEAPAGGSAAAADAGAEAAGAKPVVSEYAKWMEGASSTPGAIDSGAEAETYKEEQDDLDEPVESYGDEDDELGPTKPVDASTPGSASAEAQRQVSSNKAETKNLQRKLVLLGEERMGYASLDDRCLEKNDGQYTYKFCFFDDAKQDSVLLGRFSGWTKPTEVSFTNGHACPGGLPRQLRVIFECGHEEIHEITEPSMCSYEARVTHPGACDEAQTAALESPPVKHPKDEL